MLKRKLLGGLLTLGVVCSGLTSCQYLENYLSSNSETLTSSENNATTMNAKLAYVQMRINPEIELVIDENNTVVSVNAVNEDGEVVLLELTLVGLTIEEAAQLFTEKAIELGYIDVDTEDAKVYVLVDGVEEELIEEIEEKVIEKVDSFFDEKGIYGRGCKEELEELKTQADEWGVTLKEAKMISRILELYPEMTLEEVLELDFEARLELIKEERNNHGELTNSLREEFKEAMATLKEEYKEMFDLEDEIKLLQESLKNLELSEEEIASIKEEIETKKLELDTLREEYEAKVKEILEEKTKKIEKSKEEIKDKFDQRVNEYYDKFKEHEEKIKEEFDKITEQIKSWRDNYKNHH